MGNRKKLKTILVLWLTFVTHYLKAQPLTEPNSTLLMKLFNGGSELFFEVIAHPEKYKYQIIYSEINYNKRGRPELNTHYFQYNKSEYLYPASLVKLPISLIALEKLRKMDDVNIHTSMITDSSWYCEQKVNTDITQLNKKPSMGGYIKKMAVVSDNESYNRIFEFLGYEGINQSLSDHGYEKSMITKRFAEACDTWEHRKTNPIYFVNEFGDTVFKQEEQWATKILHNPYGEVFMGKSYYDASGYLYPFPRSFYYHNFLPLDELHIMMASLFVPQAVSSTHRFKLEEEGADSLRRWMGLFPQECVFPTYHLPFNYKKYFLWGDGTHKREEGLRSFNIVGRAYGVLAESAYIVDSVSGVAFLLTARIYCNDDEILNDNSYEYDSVGLPWMTELSRMVLDYERRKRK